jgi:hypothetical protein
MLSLPIPDPAAPFAYQDISFDGASLGPLVESLTHGKIGASTPAHLDPDLRPDARPRLPGWCPLFGQAGAAQGHLRNQGVAPGDLFLFYGWFRPVELHRGGWRWVKHDPGRHILFGWLQVGEMLPAGGPVPDWAQSHPHVAKYEVSHEPAVNGYEHEDSESRRKDMLYVAPPRLSLSEPSADSVPAIPASLPGAGVFTIERPELCLTCPSQQRSLWRLPAWFHPAGRPSALTYHESPLRWSLTAPHTYLHTVPRGQEFVLDLAHYLEAFDWLQGIFSLTSKNLDLIQ